jgi:cytidylate kinase
MRRSDPEPLIGIVGVCAAGKSTITACLRALGLRAKPIAQEHSYVKDMWLRLTHPDILIFLDASYLVTVARKNLNWTEAEYLEQHDRLRHARQHADLYIFSDKLTPQQVVDRILGYLRTWRG